MCIDKIVTFRKIFHKNVQPLTFTVPLMMWYCVIWHTTNLNRYYKSCFYSTALRGRNGIVFSYGVRMGGGKKVVRAVSTTVVLELILPRDIG